MELKTFGVLAENKFASPCKLQSLCLSILYTPATTIFHRVLFVVYLYDGFFFSFAVISCIIPTTLMPLHKSYLPLRPEQRPEATMAMPHLPLFSCCGLWIALLSPVYTLGKDFKKQSASFSFEILYSMTIEIGSLVNTFFFSIYWNRIMLEGDFFVKIVQIINFREKLDVINVVWYTIWNSILPCTVAGGKVKNAQDCIKGDIITLKSIWHIFLYRGEVVILFFCSPGSQSGIFLLQIL